MLVGADAALTCVSFGAGAEVGSGLGRGVLEGAEAEDAGNNGPAVGDVRDHDGGGAFAGVPIKVHKGAVGGGKIEVAI